MKLDQFKKKEIISAVCDLGHEDEVTLQAVHNEAEPFMVSGGDKVAIYPEDGGTSFYLVGVVSFDLYGLFNMETGILFSEPIKEIAPFDVRKTSEMSGWTFNVIARPEIHINQTKQKLS